MRSETVRVPNDGDARREVIVEPWGEQLVVPPGGVLELFFVGPDDGAAEIADDGAVTAVYGWAGSSVVARLAGEVVFDASDKPVPSSPGTSMQEFVSLLFGGPGKP